MVVLLPLTFDCFNKNRNLRKLILPRPESVEVSLAVGRVEEDGGAVDAVAIVRVGVVVFELIPGVLVSDKDRIVPNT